MPDSENFVVLSMLLAYQQFEIQNPVSKELKQYTVKSGIERISQQYGVAAAQIRDQYLVIEDDNSYGWSLSTTASYLTLGLTNSVVRPVNQITPEQADALFSAQPDWLASAIISLYKWTEANASFRIGFVTALTSGQVPSPLANFISLASYTGHHAHRSPRSRAYAYLCLLVLRILTEDPQTARSICSNQDRYVIGLCRHRSPRLATTEKKQLPVAALLNVLLDTTAHNMKKAIDISFHT